MKVPSARAILPVAMTVVFLVVPLSGCGNQARRILSELVFFLDEQRILVLAWNCPESLRPRI